MNADASTNASEAAAGVPHDGAQTPADTWDQAPAAKQWSTSPSRHEGEPALQVRLKPNETQTSKDVDVDADLHINIATHITGIGRIGLIVGALGVVAFIVGAAMFVAAYPGVWKGTASTEAETMATVERTIVILGMGITGILLGTAFFFHGRQVLGSGSVQHLSLISQLDKAGVADPVGTAAATAASAVMSNATASQLGHAAPFDEEGAIRHFTENPAGAPKEEDP